MRHIIGKTCVNLWCRRDYVGGWCCLNATLPIKIMLSWVWFQGRWAMRWCSKEPSTCLTSNTVRYHVLIESSGSNQTGINSWLICPTRRLKAVNMWREYIKNLHQISGQPVSCIFIVNINTGWTWIVRTWTRIAIRCPIRWLIVSQETRTHFESFSELNCNRYTHLDLFGIKIIII